MSAEFEDFAYVTHLRTEHRRLRACLHRIEQQWLLDIERPRRTDDIPRVIDSLEALCAELAHHFAEEESGGCLEEAVSHRPNLSGEANRLRCEHTELVGRLQGLIARLRLLPRPGESIDRVGEDFRRFADDLRAHQAGENRVLEQSFGIKVE
jgi:hemerythrin-like domain-containing protein